MTLHARGGLLLALWLLVGFAQAGTRHYYYTDPQGTPLAKTDANGTILATYDYAPYGTPVVGMSGAPDGPGYTGHVNDPDTGLVYMQARYYDPAVGRFLSVDPIPPGAGNLFNFTRYDYVSNNPIINIDPDGRQKFSGYGSTLKVDGDCHQANNCQTINQANEMMQQDAKAFVAFQGGIIVSAGAFVVAPEAMVPAAKIIKNNSKEIGRQALCVMALTCHGQSGPEDVKKYNPTMTMVRHEKTIEHVARRIKIEEASRQRSSLQLTSPPSPPPPPPPPMN